jgi:hypothetical protein
LAQVVLVLTVPQPKAVILYFQALHQQAEVAVIELESVIIMVGQEALAVVVTVLAVMVAVALQMKVSMVEMVLAHLLQAAEAAVLVKQEILMVMVKVEMVLQYQ